MTLTHLAGYVFDTFCTGHGGRLVIGTDIFRPVEVAHEGPEFE